MKLTSAPCVALAAAACLVSGSALAFTAPDRGRLALTGGVSALEGAGGGGLSTWALIAGLGTRDSFGLQLRHTTFMSRDYRLTSPGVSVGLFNRVEVSYARQRLDETGGALEGSRIEMDTYGLKLRLLGDAILDQDRPWPQISVGLQHKRNRGIQGLETLGLREATDIGARRNRDTDYYLATSKLFLGQSLLVNGTVRFTRANQFGLAGFGGDRGDRHEAQFEGSLAWLLRGDLALGVEYRSKPRNLSIDREDDAHSLYVAWQPNKHVSATVAYVNVGPIVSGNGAMPLNGQDQRGLYLSLQLSY